MLYKKAFLLARSLLILYIMLYLGNLIARRCAGEYLGFVSAFYRLNYADDSFGVDLLWRKLVNSFYGNFVCTGECGNYQIFRLIMGTDEYFVNSEYRQHLYYVSFYRRDGKYAV